MAKNYQSSFDNRVERLACSIFAAFLSQPQGLIYQAGEVATRAIDAAETFYLTFDKKQTEKSNNG